MNRLPSIWGQHETAQFEPVMVRGTLVTVVLNEPDAWRQRLEQLGFRRAQTGWARLGALAQAEYGYLSPEIDLVSLRPEMLHEAVNDPDGASRPPYDVADAILHLWQRQRQSIHAALAIEHQGPYSDPQVWSFVESSLLGAQSPECETVYGLAKAKLESISELNAASSAFFQRVGLLDQEFSVELPERKVEAIGGEFVEWTDSAGGKVSGRLASTIREGDKGGWAYELSPAWAGGYPVPSPIWVDKSQFLSSEKVADQGDMALGNEAGSPSQAETSLEISVADLKVVGDVQKFRFLEVLFSESYGKSVLANWDSATNPILERMRIVNEMPADQVDDIGKWVDGLKRKIDALSFHVFGDEPIRFALVGNREMCSAGTLVLRYSVAPVVESGDQTSAIAAHHPVAIRLESDHQTPPHEQGERILNIGSACLAAEEVRAARQKVIQASSADLAQLLGATGHLLPAREFESVRPDFWDGIAKRYQGQLSDDQVLRVMSVLMRSDCNVQNRLHSGLLNASFDLTLELTREGDRADIKLKRINAKLINISELGDRTANGLQLTTGWTSEAASIDFTAFEVTLKRLSPTQYELPVLTQVNVLDEDGGYNGARIIIKDRSEALDVYVQALTSLRAICSPDQHPFVDQSAESARNFDLFERVAQVPKKLAALPREELLSKVIAELFRQSKNFSGWNEKSHRRFAEAICEGLTTKPAQGFAFAASPKYFWKELIPSKASILAQSREAELGSFLADWKLKLNKRAQYGVIDAIAIADPDLAALLNGGGPAVLKEAKAGDGSYQDTGVVAGLAAKDIRGWGRDYLLGKANEMNDSQRKKYLTKDLIWPRRSMLELRELGVDIKTAYSYDMIWKALPKEAKSVSWEHVQAFINLITQFKDGLEAKLKLPMFGGEQSFNDSAYALSIEVFSSDRLVAQTYKRNSELKFQKYALWLNSLDFLRDPRITKELSKIEWSDYVKESERKKPVSTMSRVQRDEVVRVGPDYREGVSVSGEDFIKTFGFSGVEYGNWTNQAEREKHLNFAFDSMMDFVRVMGWEPLTLSLGGRLGLCIGSRGHGGKRAASAHFEPVNLAINLTRMRGDGSLAHEYFHAIANHYGRLATGRPQDLLDSFGFPLQKSGPVPSIPSAGGLRQPVVEGFYNLLVAIMRAPGKDSDDTDISNYELRSQMLVNSLAEDGKSAKYWALPSEMFARAMEIWFKARLTESNERNDYLVGAGKSAKGDVYPTEDHLARIDKFVGPWLDALSVEMKQINHPHLGDMSIPVLNTEHKSSMPLTPPDLVALADAELKRMFAHASPSVMFLDDPNHNAGLYSLARDLIALNAQYADRGTFYHEAWHAGHAKLLSTNEQELLSRVFAPGGEVACRVAEAMRESGMEEAVLHMQSSTLEIQAYAFQLWEQGRFEFKKGDEGKSSFSKVDGFIAGVESVTDLLGGEAAAECLFSRFLSGELAESVHRNAQSVSNIADDLADPDWDDNSMLVWHLASPAAGEKPPLRSHRPG